MGDTPRSDPPLGFANVDEDHESDFGIEALDMAAIAGEVRAKADITETTVFRSVFLGCPRTFLLVFLYPHPKILS